MVDPTDPRGLVPPSQLWAGSADGFETVALEVRVCQGPQGHVWSAHDFHSDQDRQRARQWSGGGARQIAHGLLVEALRREAYASLLVGLSADRDLLSRHQAASPEEQALLEQKLSQGVREILNNLCDKVGPAIAREVFLMMGSQLPSPKK